MMVHGCLHFYLDALHLGHARVHLAAVLVQADVAAALDQIRHPLYGIHGSRHRLARTRVVLIDGLVQGFCNFTRNVKKTAYFTFDMLFSVYL